MNLELKGKRALVFGASSGIGLGIATSLADQGAAVVLCARDVDKLAKAAASCGAQGFETADLYDPSSGKAVVQRVLDKYGDLDILVTHNGGPPHGGFMDIDAAGWQRGFDGLILNPILAIQAVLPKMRAKRWGRVLMITSIAAREPIPGVTVSNVLRAGISGLAKSLSDEVAGDGVTVNALLPGFTLTSELTPRLQGLAAQVPAKRLATPADHGHLAAFLASDRGAYITGQAIACDGGYLRSV